MPPRGRSRSGKTSLVLSLSKGRRGRQAHHERLYSASLARPPGRAAVSGGERPSVGRGHRGGLVVRRRDRQEIDRLGQLHTFHVAPSIESTTRPRGPTSQHTCGDGDAPAVSVVVTPVCCVCHDAPPSVVRCTAPPRSGRQRVSGFGDRIGAPGCATTSRATMRSADSAPRGGRWPRVRRGFRLARGRGWRCSAAGVDGAAGGLRRRRGRGGPRGRNRRRRRLGSRDGVSHRLGASLRNRIRTRLCGRRLGLGERGGRLLFFGRKRVGAAELRAPRGLSGDEVLARMSRTASFSTCPRLLPLSSEPRRGLAGRSAPTAAFRCAPTIAERLTAVPGQPAWRRHAAARSANASAAPARR